MVNYCMTDITLPLSKSKGKRGVRKTGSKKDALTKPAIENPTVITMKIARKTNNKVKTHDHTNNNNVSNVETDKIKPFEMVFARMEKRKMDLKKNSNNSTNKKPKK